MRVKLYVAAVCVTAAVVCSAVALTTTGWRDPNLGVSLLYVVVVAVAASLQIRYRHGRSVDALVLLEGTFAPLIFAASGARAVALIGTGILIAEIVRRNAPIKRLFNLAQWMVSATAGIAVWHALDLPHDASLRTLAGLMLAVLCVVATNQVLITGVLFAATGHPLGSAESATARSVMSGRMASLIGAVVLGVFMTGAYLWQAWTVVLVIPPIVFLYAAGRAQAALRADGLRLEGLQRATHALATSIDTADGLPKFLREVLIGFEVREAQLVLLGKTADHVYTCVGAECAVTDGTHELARRVAADYQEPTRLDGPEPASSYVAERGYTRVLAVPLQSGGDAVGALFLYDRLGMEGFESGEIRVADALARELVGFLERVKLLHAIEEERRKMADILGATSDGIFCIEADGTITSWNAGLAAMTGYGEEEVVGTRHFGMLRPRDAQGRDILIERWVELIANPGSLPAELQIVTAGGQTVWLSCSYSRIPAGETRPDSLVVVARNITQARELERLKDDFVAVVSHELRTPLVPIKGWAQTLLNRGDRLNDDQRRTAVQSILAQAQKLESLVLNILEASRIEAGRSDAEGTADVASVAARIVEDTLASRPDRTVRLRPPSVPCHVRGSAVWVERAVSNLVANAIKYSPDEETVDVAITTEGDDVVVAVTDRGPGIAPEAQERIFERFERLEETRKQTGTGLGLYITRRLARAMGGDVTVSSMPGAGSTFLLRLPLAPSNMQRMPEQRRDAAVREAATEAPNVVHLR